MTNDSYAILIDGAFLIRKIGEICKRFPTADDIEVYSNSLRTQLDLAPKSLLRIYFYHARPLEHKKTNPISKEKIWLTNKDYVPKQNSLMDKLELKRDFALRLGELKHSGWKVKDHRLRQVIKDERALQAEDLLPNVQQKGVDLRIGLDIARLSLRCIAKTVVVVTGDSDMIPAFKFARREGVRVYLDCLDHPVTRDLKVHTDAMVAWEDDQLKTIFGDTKI